jgi:prefoldin subunit 4
MSSNGETDVEVRASDQREINEFGRLNTRMHDLEEDLKEQRAAYDQIDDAASELMLADDDETVR